MKPILTVFVGINLLLSLGSQRFNFLTGLIKISDYALVFKLFTLILVGILRMIRNFAVKLRGTYALTFSALNLFAFCGFLKRNLTLSLLMILRRFIPIKVFDIFKEETIGRQNEHFLCPHYHKAREKHKHPHRSSWFENLFHNALLIEPLELLWVRNLLLEIEVTFAELLFSTITSSLPTDVESFTEK